MRREELARLSEIDRTCTPELEDIARDMLWAASFQAELTVSAGKIVACQIMSSAADSEFSAS